MKARPHTETRDREKEETAALVERAQRVLHDSRKLLEQREVQLREMERLLKRNPEITHGLETRWLEQREPSSGASPPCMERESATILMSGTAPSGGEVKPVAKPSRGDSTELIRHRFSQAKRFRKIAEEAYSRASVSRFDEWTALRARKRLDGVESNGEHEQSLTHTEELLQVSRNVLNNTRHLLREVKASRRNSQQLRRAHKESMKA